MLSLEGPVKCTACEAEEYDPDDIDDPDRGILDLSQVNSFFFYMYKLF